MNDYFDIFLANIYTQNNIDMSNKFFENLTEEEDDCEKDKEEACYL
jgi:hypothetical protein